MSTHGESVLYWARAETGVLLRRLTSQPITDMLEGTFRHGS
jgi:hypothetical protein